MEGHGTGGNVEQRVVRLETGFEQLHKDSLETRASLASLGASLDGVTRTVQDIAEKLDDTRTRKPNYIGMISAIISAAAVIITIGILALSPIVQRQDRFRDDLIEIRSDVGNMKGDRFTKQDGHRLEDKIDRIDND